jgi:N-acyl-D-amino-acid deacylase
MAAAFLAAVPPYRPSADFDVLITGGMVIDGTGGPRRPADVGITADRITAIGDLSGRTATRTIDAHGLVVAPGFIDMLGWSHLTILVDNRGYSKVTQGVTTEITGEGWSPAPVNDATLRPDAAQYAAWGLTIDWHDLDGYFRRIERAGIPFNIATFVGATTLRLYVMGEDNRAPTPDELARMEALADSAMRQGALGVSSALIYEPGRYAGTDELIALARVAARHGGIYASHIRGEGAGIRRALAEAFRIGREAGVPVEVWHLKLSGRPQWGHMREIIGLFERERAAGARVGANSYPYIASASTLSQVLPAWVRVGGDSAMVARLHDPSARARIRRDVRSVGGVMVLATLNPALARYQGRRVSDIARAEHRREADVVMDILMEDGGKTGAAFFSMSEADVRATLEAPWIGVGSDFGATAPDGPLFNGPVHPRAYGTFPRILGHYVREEHVLTLETAVHKMTQVPAERAGLTGRGLLREGNFADITVFDPETVIDRATFESPHLPAAGIRYVLVNGRLSLDDGRLTDARPGRALRGPGYQP